MVTDRRREGRCFVCVPSVHELITQTVSSCTEIRFLYCALTSCLHGEAEAPASETVTFQNRGYLCSPGKRSRSGDGHQNQVLLVWAPRGAPTLSDAHQPRLAKATPLGFDWDRMELPAGFQGNIRYNIRRLCLEAHPAEPHGRGVYGRFGDLMSHNNRFFILCVREIVVLNDIWKHRLSVHGGAVRPRCWGSAANRFMAFRSVPPPAHAFYRSRRENVSRAPEKIWSLSILEAECVFDHALVILGLYEVQRVLIWRVIDEHERAGGWRHIPAAQGAAAGDTADCLGPDMRRFTTSKANVNSALGLYWPHVIAIQLFFFVFTWKCSENSTEHALVCLFVSMMPFFNYFFTIHAAFLLLVGLFCFSLVTLHAEMKWSLWKGKAEWTDVCVCICACLCVQRD